MEVNDIYKRHLPPTFTFTVLPYHRTCRSAYGGFVFLRLKYMPYAFTEQGVAMLSSVLRSQTAIEVNIQIMRAFVSMRHFMVNNASVFSRLETIEYHQLEIQQHQQ